MKSLIYTAYYIIYYIFISVDQVKQSFSRRLTYTITRTVKINVRFVHTVSLTTNSTKTTTIIEYRSQTRTNKSTTRLLFVRSDLLFLDSCRDGREYEVYSSLYQKRAIFKTTVLPIYP
jgi:hypothetical protein